MARELCQRCGGYLFNVQRLWSTSSRRLTSRQIPILMNQSRSQSQQHRDPFKRSFPKEAKPDYDLEGSGFIDEGEVIFPEPEPQLTDVEEVKDPGVWKYVERLLKRSVVPELPDHQSYPTPSGWVPPHEMSLTLPYQITRTKYHHLPLYLETFDGGARKMTCIKRVDGDIWALEKDLRSYIEGLTEQLVYTSVDEVCGKVRVRGNYMEDVSKFLLEQGF